MALNFLKKKSKPAPPPKAEEAKAPKQSQNKEVKKKEEKKSKEKLNLIFSPHISEKSTSLQSASTYVFRVSSELTKSTIKRAIEQHYDVEIKLIRTIQVHPRKRHRGPIVGKRSGFKKAVITLREGQVIDEL